MYFKYTYMQKDVPQFFSLIGKHFPAIYLYQNNLAVIG